MHDFKALVENIQYLNRQLQHSAVNTVNRLLTIRNWLIGYYIVEFEQNGKDRADYGTALLKQLSNIININGLTAPELSRCRQFYNTYPQILGTLSQEKVLPTSDEKTNSISPFSVISKLSFSHIVELIKIEDSLKRTFYEIECIKGAWSVRELRRQIASMYFERSGLSTNPEKLSKLISQKTKPQATIDIIKNIYAFEFLDLPVKEIVEESDLDKALLNNLQNFIIEMELERNQ